MNVKSIAAVLAGFLTLMLSGFLFYEFLLKSYFTKFMETFGDCFLKEPPILPMLIAHLCFSIFLYFLLSRNKVTSFAGGIGSAWFVIVLLMVWYDAWSFTYIPQLTLSMAVVDVAVNSTCSLLAAGVIGWVLGKFQ